MSELWAVTMVRDELDVIEYTLRHLASEGVDGIIVADNGSVDGTFEWLKTLEDQTDLGCHFMLLQDPEVGYYQSRKMTTLVDIARQMGADWVIPFDADEVWWADGGSLHDVVAKLDAADLQPRAAALHNYFPTKNPPKNTPNPFQRILRRDPQPAPLPKVLVRPVPGIQIHQGNHGATVPGVLPRYLRSSLHVGHFPWRSYAQFERKVRNGLEAYRATDLPEDMGAHWRSYGEMLETHGPDALRAHYETWFEDPAIALVTDPVPYRRFG